MGDLYGTSINTLDPNFGALTNDARILAQRAELALDTPAGSLDGFPEYGFVWDQQVLRAVDATQLALLPLEVRTAIEQEPAIETADVQVVSSTPTPGGGVALSLAINVTGAAGDKAGFTVGS